MTSRAPLTEEVLSWLEQDAERYGDTYRTQLVRRARAGDDFAISSCRTLALGGVLARVLPVDAERGPTDLRTARQRTRDRRRKRGWR